MINKRMKMNKTNRVYDTPFLVEEKEVITDSKTKVQKEIWNKKYRLYADGKNLYGKEYELARQIGNEKTIKFYIRYGPRVDETMRIVFNNKIFDIENIDNIGFKNEVLEIKAREKRFGN